MPGMWNIQYKIVIMVITILCFLVLESHSISDVSMWRSQNRLPQVKIPGLQWICNGFMCFDKEIRILKGKKLELLSIAAQHFHWKSTFTGKYRIEQLNINILREKWIAQKLQCLRSIYMVSKCLAQWMQNWIG